MKLLKEKFVVLSHPRSGSTFFCKDILSAHPAVYCFGEVFHENNFNSRKAMEAIGVLPYYLERKNPMPQYADELYFLDELLTVAAEKMGKECIGFKLFTHQVLPPTLMQILRTNKVI